MTTTNDNAAQTMAIPGPPIRLAVDELSPRTNRAMNSLDAAARDNQLDARLQELVRMRASQINGCAYCVDMHSTDALAAGVPAKVVNLVAVWREVPYFDVRERAALELTEAMTRLADAPISDELFAAVAGHFSDRELSDLIWLIAVINTWNRLGATAHPWPLS